MQGGGQFVGFGWEKPCRAGRPQSFLGDNAIAGERAVAVNAAEGVVFGHEQGDGDPVPLVDGEIVAKFGDLIPVEESQGNFLAGLGNSGEHGTLFDAIPTPYPAEDQDVHFAGKPCEQLFLPVG